MLAGCYPGAKSQEQAEKRLDKLLGVGIRLVIDLMEDHERDWKGEEIRDYKTELGSLAEAKGIKIGWIRMPTPEMGIPTIAGMKSILNEIDRAMAEGKPVYVHCWGGKGRTGTVVGCYLVRHGMAVGKEALAMIKELRKDDVGCREPSPENERQRWLVYSWRQGE